jgi:hypothetical protein
MFKINDDIARKIFHEIKGLKLTFLRRDQNFMFGMSFFFIVLL